MRSARLPFRAIVAILLVAAWPLLVAPADAGHTITLTGSGYKLSARLVELAKADLEASQPKFLSGLGNDVTNDLKVDVTYTCATTASGAQGAGTAQCHPTEAKVFYTMDGTNPHTSPAKQPPLALNAVNTGPGTPPQDDPTARTRPFTGNWAAGSFNDMADGGVVKFYIEAKADYAPSDTTQEPKAVKTVLDPPSTAAKPFYQFKIDRSRPNATFAPTSVYGVVLDANVWHMYTKVAKPPQFGFVFSDDTAGSALNNTTFSVKLKVQQGAATYYNEASQAANFTTANRIKLGDHLYAWAYTFPTANATLNAGFAEGRMWKWTVEAKDAVKNLQLRSGLQTYFDDEAPLLARADIPGNPGTVGAGRTVPVEVEAWDPELACRSANGIAVNAQRACAGQDNGLNLSAALVVTARLVNGTTEASAFATLKLEGNNVGSTCDTNTAVKNCRWRGNAPVPSGFPSGKANVSFTATDLAGNAGSVVSSKQVVLDTVGPEVEILAPTAEFLAAGPYTVRADVTDEDSGVQPPLKLSYRLGSAAPKETSMAFQGGTVYQGVVNENPADGTVVNFTITATDQAGATTEENATFTVDKAGPEVEAADDLDFVSEGPFTFAFNVTDGGSGVNETSGTLFWRLKGTSLYTEEELEEASSGVFEATVPDQAEDVTIQWYVEVKDLLGNLGILGTRTAPRETGVDKTAPTLLISSPPISSLPRFNVSWTGSDAVSGVALYTVEYRDDVTNAWAFLVENSTATGFQFCAIGGREYSFRGFAEDRAGNVGTLPAEPQARTFVDSEDDCVDPPDVTITAPAAGANLTGDVTVQWSAESVQAAFQDSELTISIELSKDGTTYETLATNLNNSGTFTWTVTSVETLGFCREDGTYTLRVSATDPSLFTGRAEVAGIRLANGITSCEDRDADGLPDEWEVQHFGNIASGPNDDADGDSFSNGEEFAAGSDPTKKASTPVTVGKAPLWEESYWVVIGLFLASVLVFAVGLVRRW